MTKLLALMLILLAVCTIASAAECIDISKVDFANRALVVGGVQQAVTPGESTLSGRAAKQVFRFRHGVSLEYEGGNNKKPDWRTTIQHDVVVRPEGSRTVRFLTLFRNHLTGSGSWTYLVGLACSGGRIQQVFQSSGVFMRVAKITPKLVQISMPLWKPSDPACCPSARKELPYTWDERTHRYTLTPLDQMSR
jgi:hypothetical protein